MQKVAIWGASELGEFIIKQIETIFLDWKIVLVVDRNESFCGKSIGNYVIENIKSVQKIEKDVWVLLTCRSVEEARLEANAFGVTDDRILYVHHTWPIGLNINPDVRHERMYFCAYQLSTRFEKLVKTLSTQGGNLNILGIKYNTDKASVLVENDRFRITHDYLRHYERVLNFMKNEQISLCELGCGKGGSLKMWKEYFSKGTIIGVDILEESKAFEEDRVKIIVGKSTSDNSIDEIKKISEKLDIVIDDASHAWGDMRISFEKLWPVLKSGGVYILEDVQCGSQGAYPEHEPVIYDSQSIFDYVIDRARIMQFGRDWNPEYNAYHFEHHSPKSKMIEKQLDEVILMHGSIMIVKR